jgi:hypothetical protein
MKTSKWPDFLFTVLVRFVCGVLLGGLAYFLFFWRGLLLSFSHDNTKGPLVVMIVCGFIGGIIAVYTIPHWQTPWYKGIRGGDDDDV